MQGQSLVSYAVFRNSFQCYVVFGEHVRGRPLKHSACCCTWSHTCQHMVTVSWSHVSCPLSHVWVWICLLCWLDFQLITHFTYDCCVHVCEYRVSHSTHLEVQHATAHMWTSNMPQHTCGGSRTTLWNEVSSTTSKWVPRIEVRSPGWHSQCLNQLSHLAGMFFFIYYLFCESINIHN